MPSHSSNLLINLLNTMTCNLLNTVMIMAHRVSRHVTRCHCDSLEADQAG